MNARATRRCRQAGVSLVEALVALAVMAFGVLGVIGLQATMRQNADVSKQRAEAVRIAQEDIEKARAFSVLTAPEPAASAPVLKSYAALATTAGQAVSGYSTNTTYTLTRTVLEPDSPRIKSVVVQVAWTDRLGQVQDVRLSTTVAGITPEAAGSLGSPPPNGAAMRQPLGRNVGIPVSAVDASDKVTSSFVPVPGVVWVFNNASGVITSICNPSLVCAPANALLLSGYVRFAAAPTPAQAETPTGTVVATDLQVVTTAPTAAAIACLSQSLPGYVAFYCAVPVVPTSTPALKWSGRLNLISSASLPISTSPADATATNYKVCRYTPTQSDTPPNGNLGHPLVYSNVDGALTNQNFLVIRAGDGTASFDCPADDAGTAFVNGNTWQHQPHL
nr:prepilin-type N-terminal cleavage/methylation domain-containing protein [uncultured Roseateles sp.]